MTNFGFFSNIAIIGDKKWKGAKYGTERDYQQGLLPKIKKMNREELTKFILQYGEQLLGEQGKTIDLPALEAELSKIKGIGGKRLEEIMVVIEKFLYIE